MHLPDPIKQFIYINGIFDIICGVGILSDIPILRDIHLSFLKSFLAGLPRFFYSSVAKKGICSQTNTFNVIKIWCFVKCNTNAFTPYVLSSA